MKRIIASLALVALVSSGATISSAQDPSPAPPEAPKTNLQNQGQQPDYSPAAKPTKKKKRTKKRMKRSKPRADKGKPAQTGKRTSGLNGEGG